MSPKQARFVEEYLVDLNATQAALRAGYSPRTANEQGARLLANVSVQEAIQTAQKDRSKRTGITAERVLQELALIGFSDIGKILDMDGESPRLRPVNEITKLARRAIASVKVRRYFEGGGEDAREVEVTEFKLWPKDAALTKLAQHLGLLVDRHEHTGKDGGPIRHATERDLTDDELATIAADQPTAGSQRAATPPASSNGPGGVHDLHEAGL